MPGQSKKLVIVISLSLILIPLTIFWQVQSHEFINYDDPLLITENPHVNTGLSLKNAAWAFSTMHGLNWHPLTWLSHMLDCHLYGLNPSGHHFNNLIFHIANTLLLFLCLRRITGTLWRSAIVAALFTIHPLHVESVAWAAERKDVLSSFFWIITIWAYFNYTKNRGLSRYLFVALCFSLGLMSKPMIVTLPPVLLLLDYWPLMRFRFPWMKKSQGPNISNPIVSETETKSVFFLILEKVPLFLLAAASSILTIIAQRQWGAVISLDTLPLGTRIANSVISYATYIGKMIWPQNLAVFYPYSTTIPPLWQFTGLGIVLISISIFVLWMGRFRHYLVVGWLWYLGTLVPVIGIVQVGSQAMADRYTYIPLIGLFIMIVWGAADLMSTWQNRRVVLGIITGAVLLSLGIRTWVQIGYWKNSFTLYERSLAVTSNNNVIHYNLGMVYAKIGKLDEAEEQYVEALRIKPDHEMALNNLGTILAKKERFEEAAAIFLGAIRINPNFEKAHTNLGVALSRLGRYENAMTHHEEALKIKPNFLAAHINYGLVLAQVGRYDEALNHFQEVLKMKRDHSEAHFYMGLTFSSKGDYLSAKKKYDLLRVTSPYLAKRLLKKILEKKALEAQSSH